MTKVSNKRVFKVGKLSTAFLYTGIENRLKGGWGCSSSPQPEYPPLSKKSVPLRTEASAASMPADQHQQLCKRLLQLKHDYNFLNQQIFSFEAHLARYRLTDALKIQLAKLAVQIKELEAACLTSET